MNKNNFLRLKEGDTVMFRNDLMVSNRYGGITFQSGMQWTIGRKVMIYDISYAIECFRILDNTDYFYYHREMLVDEPKFKFGK